LTTLFAPSNLRRNLLDLQLGQGLHLDRELVGNLRFAWSAPTAFLHAKGAID
jgi:hypothetical protein